MARQCEPHRARITAQWREGPSLFPPSGARGCHDQSLPSRSLACHATPCPSPQASCTRRTATPRCCAHSCNPTTQAGVRAASAIHASVGNTSVLPVAAHVLRPSPPPPPPPPFPVELEDVIRVCLRLGPPAAATVDARMQSERGAGPAPPACAPPLLLLVVTAGVGGGEALTCSDGRGAAAALFQACCDGGWRWCASRAARACEERRKARAPPHSPVLHRGWAGVGAPFLSQVGGAPWGNTVRE